jgi:Flp pilus assembly protein TadG
MSGHNPSELGTRDAGRGGHRIVASLRGALKDRRGATAALFGVAATAVVGFAGLATEAGFWYNIRRDAQNAADAAAYAGAVRLAFATNVLQYDSATKLTHIQNTGRDVTSRNGYENGANNNTVAVNWPPASGAYAGNTSAVQVIITHQRPRLMSALFMAGSNQQLQTIGVAALHNLGTACVLAKTQSLIIGGNTTLMAPGCLLASNSTDIRSINFNGGTHTIDAAYLAAAGGCDGCSAAVTPGGAAIPYSTYGGGVTDPFANWVPNVVQPALSCSGAGSTEGPIHAGTTTATVGGNVISSNYYVICKNWRINASTTTTLPGPGTYFFYGTSLDVQGTLNWTCAGANNCSTTTLGGPGVTLAFVRDNNGNVGTFGSNALAVMDLKAPAAGYGPYPGLVIYRQPGAHESGVVTSGIQINGSSASTRLAGAVYAPNADVIFNGNADIAQSGCLIVVGAKVELTGNSYTRAGNCSELNPNIATYVQVARLVE